MQRYFDIARIFKQDSSDEELDAADQERVKRNAPPGTVYSSVGGPLRRRVREQPTYEYGTRPERAKIARREGGWSGNPDTGKEENPYPDDKMEKSDEYKLHQQGKMGGTEEVYSMGNRSKTQVQKMYRIFKAPSRLQDTLDRQAQSSQSVRGGPEGQGGTGSFEEAQNIGRGVIDQSIQGIMWNRNMGERKKEALDPEGAGLDPVPNNTPRTDNTQTSEQTQTPVKRVPEEQVKRVTDQPTPKPKVTAQNPFQQRGATPKADAGPSGAKPKPTAQQQFYSQDVKMVEKMARIFRV